MRIIGCDFHAGRQTLAMLDRDTGEITRQTLKHEGNTVATFFRALRPPVVVGIEATGAMSYEGISEGSGGIVSAAPGAPIDAGDGAAATAAWRA